MSADLTPYLDRIAAHLKCLASAAEDESASPEVRAAVAGQAAVFKAALALEGALRDDSERSETATVTSEHERTEASDG